MNYGARKRRSKHTASEIDLTYSRLKLARAQSQIFELSVLIERFFDNVEYKTVVKCKPVRNRKGKISYTFDLEASIKPDPSIPIVIGDILNNLRSSLNYIAFLGVSAGESGSNSRPDFPISENAAAFKKSVPRVLRGASDKFLKWAHNLEAHGEAGDKRLWHLSSLNNQDKHEAILVCDEIHEGRGISFPNGYIEHLEKGGNPSTFNGGMPRPIGTGKVIFKNTRVLSGHIVLESIKDIEVRTRQVVDSAASDL